MLPIVLLQAYIKYKTGKRYGYRRKIQKICDA